MLSETGSQQAKNTGQKLNSISHVDRIWQSMVYTESYRTNLLFINKCNDCYE